MTIKEDITDMVFGYHGTSLERAQGILKEGYKKSAPMLWSVSTGNMHVIVEKYSHLAVTQSLNATVASSSLRRAVVVVDITNKRLEIDSRCHFDEKNIAFEIRESVKPKDIVAIYADVKPINPIFKVLQKVSLCKEYNKSLFKSELIELTEEEQEVYNILKTTQVEPNYKSKMELIYKKEGCKVIPEYLEGGF